MKADRDESSPYAAMLAAQDAAVRCKVNHAACTYTSAKNSATREGSHGFQIAENQLGFE